MVRENMGTVPEKGNLPKGTFMSIVRTIKVEAPVLKRNHFPSNEKTGSRQSCDCHTRIINNRYLLKIFISWRIKLWVFKIEDTTEVRERCIKPSVLTAKKSAKFLSNPGKIVRYIAGTVFPSTKIAVVKKVFLAGSSSDNREKSPDFELTPGRLPDRLLL
jgi:hypothetical protein